MSRWFRFYAETLRNPKVMRLSDKDYRTWTQMLAVASENEGQIPPLDDLKLILGMRLDHLQGGLDRLISGGLIDALAVGYEPHNWSKFQYKSDTSNERVAKHRAKCNVTVTPPDTETDTEVLKDKPLIPTRQRDAKLKLAAFELPDWVPEQAWADWLAMRKASRFPNTPGALKLAVRELRKFAEDGQPPGMSLEHATLRGWRGIFEIKDKPNDRSMERNYRPDCSIGNVRTQAATSLVAQYGTRAVANQSGRG